MLRVGGRSRQIDVIGGLSGAPAVSAIRCGWLRATSPRHVWQHLGTDVAPHQPNATWTWLLPSSFDIYRLSLSWRPTRDRLVCLRSNQKSAFCSNQGCATG